VQAILAWRVIARMVATANGRRIERQTELSDPMDRVSVLVPVLNEATRLRPCLDGLVAQGPEVAEILVIDGGSTDGTPAVAGYYAARDHRVRLVSAAPVPAGRNGKAHGLQVGLRESDRGSRWILTIDADVRPDPLLVRSLLAHAHAEHLPALSAATRQRLSGPAEGLVHPAMLATLVYRYGIPGHATDRVERVQANGQCFLVWRDVLEAVGGFAGVMDSVCEDVTLARALAAEDCRVGFYETDDLVAVEMYAGWRDAWDNWTRSLPMRDRFARGDVGLAEVLLVQALPPWLLPLAWALGGRLHTATLLNVALVCTRLGVLAGMGRAYVNRPATYWLSPLCDLPVALRLWQMARRRTHTWRGRALVPGDPS
jgi:dolichol-phosphate mannosyltransferase